MSFRRPDLESGTGVYPVWRGFKMTTGFGGRYYLWLMPDNLCMIIEVVGEGVLPVSHGTEAVGELVGFED